MPDSPQPAPRDSAPDREPGNNNLPLELSGLVGRGQEILRIARLLSEHRLLTLTGPGGSGKTRLALAVAQEVVRGYEDGAWLVELAPLSDPNLVPPAVASVLGVREEPGGPLAETLAVHLRPKTALLVLDNCEHLVGASASLAEALLGRCPGLKILATSREPLGVGGEALFVVPPLSLPDPRRPPAADALWDYEAVRLFVERAKAVRPDFALAEGNAPAVARICHRLDGIPLAIELAAARVRALSAEQIASRLEDRFDLLNRGGGRTTTPHQGTLLATMRWSHDLLSEGERTLFRRLSVFAGGLTLEAAERVCAGGGIEQTQVLDLLASLVDKSLVLVAERDGQARYRLLETVRQYAYERLRESGEDDQLGERHASLCLTLVEDAGPGLAESREEAWARLRAELDNIRAALAFAFGSGRTELGLRLAGALERFWWAGWHLGEGRRWLERGLAGSDGLPRSVRAKALGEAGRIALWQDDLGPAAMLFEEALGLFEDLGDERGVASSLANLGHVVLHQGDRGRLGTLREEAEALREQLTDRWAVAELLLFLGMVDLHGGDREQATASLERSMAAFREIGDEGRVATYATYVWMAALERGDLGHAVSLLRDDLRRSWRRGIRLQACDALLGLAVVAALRDRPARATRLWGAAEALREEVGVLLSPWSHVPTDFGGRLAATRSRLDRGSWEAAWSEGRAMALGRAVEYALEEEERPRASAPSHPAGLSAREVEVLRLVARGMTNAQVAAELYISPRTVHRHLHSIYSKIGVSSRTAAARFAADQDLL